MGLVDGEGPGDLEIECVVGAQGNELILGGDGAGYAEGGDGRVEEGRLDVDGKVRVLADGVGFVAQAGLGCVGRVEGDFTDGMGIDEVTGGDEIVGMPLRLSAGNLEVLGSKPRGP